MVLELIQSLSRSPWNLRPVFCFSFKHTIIGLGSEDPVRALAIAKIGYIQLSLILGSELAIN